MRVGGDLWDIYVYIYEPEEVYWKAQRELASRTTVDTKSPAWP